MPPTQLIGRAELVATVTALLDPLFADRAHAVVPEFRLDSSNAEAVAAICKRLDGIPLAIELAAARTNTLEPQVLLAMLWQRLPLLSAGAPDLPLRQRTLRGTVAWSDGLLEPTERTLFRRLAVFAGGWTIDAAEAVCADPDSSSVEIVSALGRLVDSSLITREPGADQRPRFSMLETVREYALERQEEAGETATIKRRHLEWSVPMMRDGAGLASCWRIPPRRRPRVLGRMLWGQMVSSRTARATTRRRSIGLTRPTSWRSSSATSSRARWPSVFKEMCASARGAGTGNHALRT